MNFEWDPNKAQLNASKHGVTFEEASEVFGDGLSLTVPDPDHSDDETRFVIFGRSIKERYLVASFTERGGRI